MARLSIQEAAQRLGFSVATVRRRVHSGALAGTQEDPPIGRWWVELPDDEPQRENGYVEPSDGCADLREMVAVLKEELTSKNEQIRELHILLQQTQAALPAAKVDRRWWRFWSGG